MCTEAQKKAIDELLFAADDLQSSANEDEIDHWAIVTLDKIKALRAAINAARTADL
jgi:hypothetical protein